MSQKETHQIRAEWPPHSGATFFRAGSGSAARPRAARRHSPRWRSKRRWSGCRSKPSRDCLFSRPLYRGRVTHYVPINDVDLPAKTARQLEEDLQKALEGKTKKKANQKTNLYRRRTKEPARGWRDGARILPERQSAGARKARTFPLVRPSDPVVHYIWPQANAALHREAFVNILNRVAYLGHSSSLISIGVVESCKAEAHWISGQNNEAKSSGCFSTQQIEVLQQVFPINERAEQSYRLPYEAVFYGPRTNEPPEYQLAFNRDWIVFRKVSGPELPVRAASRRDTSASAVGPGTRS